MIDGTNTAFEWQAHSSDILVLPVGAFEQHSVHMPLDTDTIQAEYFGRFIAEELDAALLPALHVATSLEHSGFRGTFSLRPETLMQVIRDIAEEAAGHGFKIMIVANGHGGNHALVPVCRDINRRDGALKIIKADFWVFRDATIAETSSRQGSNFHCNEMETSIMLAIAPDLVRPERADAEYTPEDVPLVQGDLTTFGVAHVAPKGAVGWPSYGSKEQGEAVIASVKKNMMPHIRDRIERLRRDWSYGGPAYGEGKETG